MRDDATVGWTARWRAGFTMIELLVVIGIIAVLAAMVFPMVQNALRAADLHRAEIEVNAIHSAIKGYLSEYSKWPVDGTFYGEIPMKMVRTLSGVPDTLTDNPRRRIFLSIGAYSTNSSGVMIDPYGNPYRFAVDEFMEGRIRDVHDPDGVYTELPGQTIAVWSQGPNGKSDTKTSSQFDDVISW